MRELIEAILRVATEDLGRRTELVELAVLGFADEKLHKSPMFQSALRSAQILIDALDDIGPEWAAVVDEIGPELPDFVDKQVRALVQTREWMAMVAAIQRSKISSCPHCECPTPKTCCGCGTWVKSTHHESTRDLCVYDLSSMYPYATPEEIAQKAREEGLKWFHLRPGEEPLDALLRHARPHDKEALAEALYGRAIASGFTPARAAGYVGSFLDVGTTPGTFLCSGTTKGGRPCSAEVGVDGQTCASAEHLDSGADIPRTPTGEAIN